MLVTNKHAIFNPSADIQHFKIHLHIKTQAEAHQYFQKNSKTI